MNLSDRHSASHDKIRKQMPSLTVGVVTLDMEVTVSLLALRNEQNQIRAFIHQNTPEFKVEGGCADLRLSEVLELLSRLGASADEAQKTVEALFAGKTIQRHRFLLTEQKAEHVRQFFPQGW